MRKIFIITLLTIYFLSFSQKGKDNYFPPSPESSSLIKYVDVPVNYSTGVINYSISIHSIKLKDISIPINLSYQSSGFKPSEIASNVGLGWELNAGGKITQNVIGQNDLDVSGPNNPYWNLPNDRDFKLPKETPNLYLNGSPYNLDSLKQSNTDYFMFSQIDQYKLETQPDLFYYSTPNTSGKFFFGANYVTKQIPFGKEKIVYNQNNRIFEIIDSFGVRYLYGIYTENINSTLNTSALEKLNGSSTSKSYTFYLTQIITPSNEYVEFIYDTVKYNLSSDKDYTRYYHSFYGGTEKITSYFSEITSKVLKSIKVNNKEQIVFNYNKFRKDIKGIEQATTPKTLDEIIIKDSREINRYNLDYGYFGINDNIYNSNIFESSLNNEDTNFRLKLKQIKKNNDNPYVFSYYNESPIGRFSTSLDHWGYLGQSSSKYTMNILFGDLNTSTKEPNLEKTKTNVLKGIALPTKGEVEFNYELNDCKDCDINYPEFYWDSFDVYSNADDNLSNELETHEISFTVPTNYLSVPVVQFYLRDSGADTTTNIANVYLYDEHDNIVDNQLFGSGNQTYPYKGTPLQKGKTYRLVLQCYDNIENENKYVSFKFLNSNNIVQTNNNVVGGLRIKEINTNDFNNIIHRRIFDYRNNNVSSGILYEKPSYFDNDSYFVEQVNNEQSAFETGSFNYIVQYSRMPSDLFGFNGYHIYYQKVSETKQDTNNINNKIKTEKYFTFHDDLRYGDNNYFNKISYNWKRGLVSQINEYKGNDILRKTTFSYSFLDTPASLVPSTEVGNHLSSPTFPNEFHQRSLEVTLYRKNINFYNIYKYRSTKLISAWYYLNKKITEENLNGKILRKEEEFIYSNPTNAQLTKTKTVLPDGITTETTYQYAHEKNNQYLIDKNMVGIPLHTTVVKKKDSLDAGLGISATETLYPFSQSEADTNTSGLPLPMRVETYGVQIPGASSNPRTEVSYDKYDSKGNLLQYTVKGGIPNAIIWGYGGTQPIAKVEGATYAQVLSALGVSDISQADIVAKSDSDTDAAKEGDLITALDTFRKNLMKDTTLSSCLVTTYTYDPLVGVTSITPPSGIRECYHYDPAGRLSSVTDVDGKILKEYTYHYKN